MAMIRNSRLDDQCRALIGMLRVVVPASLARAPQRYKARRSSASLRPMQQTWVPRYIDPPTTGSEDSLMDSAPQPDRRRFLRDGAYLSAAGVLLAGEASGAEVPASSVPFANLEPQSPINIRADAYGQTALNLSRLAAMTTRCKLDIAYGSGAAQRLDVYMPADKSAKGLPVFMNIHGGGWTHGYKEWMGLNAPVITQFPAVYVAIEYGLSPTQRHPKLLHDCLQALAWVHKNIAGYGGDPQRLFIGGHSAGAHLAALTTVRRDLFAQYGLPPDVIKGCLPYSGVYDFRDMVLYGQSAAGGPAENLFAQENDKVDASPIAFLEGLQTPF